MKGDVMSSELVALKEAVKYAESFGTLPFIELTLRPLGICVRGTLGVGESKLTCQRLVSWTTFETVKFNVLKKEIDFVREEIQAPVQS